MFQESDFEIKENYAQEFNDFMKDKKRNKRLRIFIAMHEEQIVGILFADLFGSDFYIDEIVIHPDYQGRAVDGLFLKKLEILIKANFPEIKTLLCTASPELYDFYNEQGFISKEGTFIDYEGDLVSTNFSKTIRTD